MPRKVWDSVAMPKRRSHTLEDLENALTRHLKTRPGNLDVVQLLAWIRERDRLQLEIAMAKPIPRLWKKVEVGA